MIESRKHTAPLAFGQRRKIVPGSPRNARGGTPGDRASARYVSPTPLEGLKLVTFVFAAQGLLDQLARQDRREQFDHREHVAAQIGALFEGDARHVRAEEVPDLERPEVTVALGIERHPARIPTPSPNST